MFWQPENITENIPSQDYTNPDDQTTLLYVTPGFKPFTVLANSFEIWQNQL